LLVTEIDLPEADEITAEQQAQWDCYESTTAKVHALCATAEGWERGFERFCDALGFDVREVRRSYGITRVQVIEGRAVSADELPLVILGELDHETVNAAARGSIRNFVCEPDDQFTRSTQIDLRTG
jgi:hypothetical protein